MKRLLLGSTLAIAVAFTTGCPGEEVQNDVPDAGAPESDAGVPQVDAGTEIPLERALAGGNPNGIALAGGRAFINVGAHLEIWDLANPAQPALLGQSASHDALLGSVAVFGNRAYVVERQDLQSLIHVLDVSNPAAISRVASFRAVDPASATSVIHWLDVDGQKLYAADQEHGIHVFDLTNADAPALVKTVPAIGATRAWAEGDRLTYFAEGFAGGWFGLIDVANDYAEIGGTSLSNVKGARMINGLLVTIGIDGIVVYRFDVNDPWTASEVYRFDGAFARSLVGEGSTAWIPGFDGLHVLDLSNPAAITRTGPLDFPTAEGDAIAVSNGLLTTATGRGLLLAVDVSAPLAPVSKSVTRLSVCTNCASLTTKPDGTLFIADVASGMKTARLRDLAELGRGTVPEMVAMEDVAVSGNLAFMSDWFYGLRIFDVANPAEPALVSSLITGGYASAVAVAGDRVVVGESTNGGALRVIDVSNPSAPVLLGSAATSKARDVELRDGLAFVADESIEQAGGLRIFDIAQPSAISMVAHYSGCANAIDVALAGNLAVLACASEGVHFIDVADPAAPAWRATWAPLDSSSPQAVAVDGQRVYVGSSTRVVALDVTDPTAPVQLASWPVSYPVRSITVPQSGRIVAACGLGGLYQWKLE